MSGYTTVEDGTPSYSQQDNLYSTGGSYDPGLSFEDSDERPAFWPPSVPGALMIFGILLSGLQTLVGLIALIKLGSNGAKVRGGHGVENVNALFTFGFIAFLYLFLGPLFVLAELRFQAVYKFVPFFSNGLVRGIIYFVWALFTFGLAGDFGIAVASMMLFLSAFNIASAYFLKN